MSQGIILLGIKHCGKSTLGQMLGKQFNCPFFDTDNVISEMTGKTPREIYQQQGAEAFMEAEARACDYLGRYLHTLGKDEYVIATGGGAVTRPENYSMLHQNGRIIWIQRSIQSLPTEGRPLSHKEKMEAMYAVRKPLYESFSDYAVSNNGQIEETIAQILSKERNL